MKNHHSALQGLAHAHLNSRSERISSVSKIGLEGTMKLALFLSCLYLCWAVITCTPQQRHWKRIGTGSRTAAWVCGEARDLLAGRLLMRDWNSGDFLDLFRKVNTSLVQLIIITKNGIQTSSLEYVSKNVFLNH